MSSGDSPSVLIVDDEAGPRRSLAMILGSGYRCAGAAGAGEALEHLRSESVDVVLLDIMLEDADGLELLTQLRSEYPDQVVIMTTAVDSTRAAVRAMKLGAYDYLTKPFDPEEIRLVVGRAVKELRMRRELEDLRRTVRISGGFGGMIGASPAVERVLRMIRRVVDSDSTVLITGESGTGKELVASALHFEGKRRRGPFVPFHCAAVSPQLLESELFGHEKGAFTGAVVAKKGMFEEADGGTLFLDEIGEMPIEMQSKLLRAIQEREIRPVGSNVTRKVDVRIVAATNRDLVEEIRKGRFREDLYYRINVVPIHLPPLRERPGDIPMLLQHFVRELSERLQIGTPPPVEPDLLAAMENYSWPGNIRELRNAVERMLVLSDGSALGVRHLPPRIRAALERGTPPAAEQAPDAAVAGGRDEAAAFEAIPEGMTLSEMTAALERRVIRRALRETGGKISPAARKLGTTRRILRYKMDRLGLSPADAAAAEEG